MQLPVQVVFEHIKPVDYIDARVRDEAKKLEQFDDRITSRELSSVGRSIVTIRVTSILSAST